MKTDDMTTEQILDAPAPFDLESREPIMYWYTMGQDVPDNSWMHAFGTKDEAESFAFSHFPGWNRKPAQSESLASMLSYARTRGRPGVAIRAYRDGKWITVREYPSGVPLETP